MNTAYFNRFVLDLPDECVTECSGPGPADAAVDSWAALVPRPTYLTPQMLVLELKEYGVWSNAELADDAANWRRIIWLAACDIREEQRSVGTEGATR